MKLIVGLGNPEKKYENTFHNLGFTVVDKVAEKLGVTFGKEKCKALVAEYGTGANKVLIAKPLTYMNLSGESVSELMSFYKIESKDILVIYDDYDLKKGEIRIRKEGSAGTHNGMKSVIGKIGTTEFLRIRVGFHPDPDCKIPLIDYVLSGIKDEDKPVFSKATDVAATAATDFAKGRDDEFIMRTYNGKITL
ncbi:MAG: aminoacyl-tRNA hydrolase [Clostridia bacterium]|nr:aminoacyl-tRNA hydrolase [Clostridia bacterium]